MGMPAKDDGLDTTPVTEVGTPAELAEDVGTEPETL